MVQKKVFSYDIFDTILSRLHRDPKSIFAFVEARYPFPNFKQLRLNAEKNSDGTLEDTYKKLCILSEISYEEGERLKEYEIQVELEQAFPILSNLNKIQSGDILVSDTYYSERDLRRILKQIGLEKDVRIYVSPAGKNSGKIWKQIHKSHQVIMHLGDNMQADVANALEAGIPATHYLESAYTTNELGAIFFGQNDAANLMRALRLQNPYEEQTTEHVIWNEQAQYNVPILIMASLYLEEYCRACSKNRILFSTRDCCHWIEIFRRIFPQYDSRTFYTSRFVYNNPSEAYVNYVKSVYSDDSVIADTQGSGTTCIDFFKKHLNTYPDYVVIVGQENHKYPIQEMTSGFKDEVERLNYALCGSLAEYTKEGPMLQAPEYDLQYVEPAHRCMRKCFEIIKHYSFTTYEEKYLQFLLFHLQANISNYITHIP